MKEIFDHVDPVAVNWSEAAIEQIFKKVAMAAIILMIAKI